MSNQISLTIPNDDPIALRAFGNALEEMAVAHGAESRKSVAAMTVKIDGTEAAQAVRDVLEEFTPEPVADDTDTDDDDTQLATNDTLDADGLPWDARIHSGNQERNADNTWRARRKPKDLTPEQWEEQVAQVRDELFALMAIPVAPAGGDYSAKREPPFYWVHHESCGVGVADSEDELKDLISSDPNTMEVSKEQYDTFVSDGYSTGLNTESPAAVFGAPDPVEVPPVAVEVPPAPPIADPVPPAPPVVAADPVPPAPPVAAAADVPATLAELMTWLTSKAPSDDAGRAKRLEQINGIVARHGLVALGQLQKRLDLIPQVYADLVKELGQ